MNQCFKPFLSLLAAIVGVAVVADVDTAIAQSRSGSIDEFEIIEIRSRPTVPVTPALTIPQALDSAFYEHGGTYFERTSLFGQVNTLFFTYPELKIRDDGASVNAVYRDAMNQQLYSDPFIRTPDLNVYNGTLLTQPYACGISPVILDEVALECSRRSR